jgi:hypothetical protein
VRAVRTDGEVSSHIFRIVRRIVSVVVVVVVRDLIAIDRRNAFTCNDVTSQKVTYMNPKSSH